MSMEKKTYLSFIKTVKCLALFVFIFATAFMMTPQRTHAAAGTTFQVNVKSGYLALRSEKAFDKSNEIGQLNTGDLVEVTDRKDSTYWYAYSPKLDKYGYANCNYLANSAYECNVRVQSGYLALRNAKAYDYANEIGLLNNCANVQVQDSSGSTYWYVYSSRLGKSGYVNKNYLQ